MTALVFLIILLGLTVGAFVVAFFVPRVDGPDKPRRYVRFAGSGLAVVFAIVFLANSMNNVSARTVGIVTEFGKATASVDAGFHFEPPWAQITEFPTSNQVTDLDATDGSPDVVQAKFDGGGTGFVNTNVTWQVETNEKAVALWNNWKDFDKVSSMVVKPRVQSVVAKVVGEFGPKESVKSENYVKIESQIKTELQRLLAEYGIKVENVNVKRIDLDATAQDRMNKQVIADANVGIAKSEQERAKIDNETANLKAQSAALTPGALIAECLKVTNAWDVQKNGPLPANWSCTGSGLALTVPVK